MPAFVDSGAAGFDSGLAAVPAAAFGALGDDPGAGVGGGPPTTSFPSSIAVGSPWTTVPKTVRLAVPSPVIRSAWTVRSRKTTSTGSAPLRFDANSLTPATSPGPKANWPTSRGCLSMSS